MKIFPRFNHNLGGRQCKSRAPNLTARCRSYDVWLRCVFSDCADWLGLICGPRPRHTVDGSRGSSAKVGVPVRTTRGTHGASDAVSGRRRLSADDHLRRRDCSGENQSRRTSGDATVASPDLDTRRRVVTIGSAVLCRRRHHCWRNIWLRPPVTRSPKLVHIRRRAFDTQSRRPQKLLAVHQTSSRQTAPICASEFAVTGAINGVYRRWLASVRQRTDPSRQPLRAFI